MSIVCMHRGDVRCSMHFIAGKINRYAPHPDSKRLALLEKQLERERQARQEADSISERTTRELYEKQRELLLLQSVAEAANEARRVDDIMQIALKQICAFTGWTLGHVYLASSTEPRGLVTPSLDRITLVSRPFASYEENRFKSGGVYCRLGDGPGGWS